MKPSQPRCAAVTRADKPCTGPASYGALCLQHAAQARNPEALAVQRARLAGRKGRGLERHAADPCAFARELGVELTAAQAVMLLGIASNPRYALACGQRTGRTMVFAVALLWWCATRPNALGLLSTPSHSHMKHTVWRQIGELLRAAGAAGRLGATWYETPGSGVQFANGGRILGIASDAGERLQGYAAPDLLIVVDEASGYPETMIASLMSNLAGGGRAVVGGNPLNNSSYFAKRWKTPGWVTANVSALDVARSADRKPGQATETWCTELLEEFGAESIVYRARVLGLFSDANVNGVFTLLEIEEAQQRYDLVMANPRAFADAGPLHLGVDVARTGADFTCVVARRGSIALAPQLWRIPDLVTVCDKVLEYARTLRTADERVVVKVDGVGVGAGVVDILKRAPDVDVVEVQAAGAPARDAYTNVRSESTFTTRDWLRASGCIARDSRLEGEMAALAYCFDQRNKLKIRSKDELRRELGRSTDRFDALALAVYAPAADHSCADNWAALADRGDLETALENVFGQLLHDNDGPIW